MQAPIDAQQRDRARRAAKISIARRLGLRTSSVTLRSRQLGHQQHATHCSSGLNLDCCSFFTSAAKTASAGAVESMQEALIEMTQWPPLRKKWSLRCQTGAEGRGAYAFRATIRCTGQLDAWLLARTA